MAEEIPIELYVSREQTGYNQFERHFLATDGITRAQTNYKIDNKKAREFYIVIAASLGQRQGQIELHCKENRQEIAVSKSLDGYFGRPRFTFSTRIFVRKLTAPERELLRKTFEKLNKPGGLQLVLVD